MTVGLSVNITRVYLTNKSPLLQRVASPHLPDGAAQLVDSPKPNLPCDLQTTFKQHHNSLYYVTNVWQGIVHEGYLPKI
jgi:hypothetical protein